MATRFDVPPTQLIEQTAEQLKKIEAIKPPTWAAWVKTGVHKDRSPTDPDWWYMRAASILRKISNGKPIGVSKLRVQYGGLKNRGMRPEGFRKGSGNIIRKILQQLEKAGLAQQKTINKHFGRVISPQGKSLLDKTAHAMAKEITFIEMKPMTIEKKVVKKIQRQPVKKAFRRPQRKFERKGAPRPSDRKGRPIRGRK